jgi:hypothetical protein
MFGGELGHFIKDLLLLEQLQNFKAAFELGSVKNTGGIEVG